MADLCHETLKNPHLLLEGGDSLFADLDQCLGFSARVTLFHQHEAGAFQHLNVPAEVALGKPCRFLQQAEIRLREFMQRSKYGEAAALMNRFGEADQRSWGGGIWHSSFTFVKLEVE